MAIFDALGKFLHNTLPFSGEVENLETKIRNTSVTLEKLKGRIKDEDITEEKKEKIKDMISKWDWTRNVLTIAMVLNRFMKGMLWIYVLGTVVLLSFLASVPIAGYATPQFFGIQNALLLIVLDFLALGFVALVGFASFAIRICGDILYERAVANTPPDIGIAFMEPEKF